MERAARSIKMLLNKGGKGTILQNTKPYLTPSDSIFNQGGCMIETGNIHGFTKKEANGAVCRLFERTEGSGIMT